MRFDLAQSVLLLEKTPAVLRTLLSDLPQEWISSDEGSATWSPVDILGHLIHGEETDWIPRTKIILDRSMKPFEPFDRFAQDEQSKGKTLVQLMDTFTLLRENNVAELKSLEISEADLELTGIHPELGEVTLKNLLATWTAHDLSHLSQITRVMAKQYRHEIGVWTKYMKIMHT